MSVLPVIDLAQGLVVRGVAGRRAEYRPIISRLTEAPDPIAIARIFRDRFGFRDLYVADLDAISGQPPALSLYARLHAEGLNLWVDAGLRTAADANPLVAAGVASIIAGLETCDGPETLAQLCREVGPARLVFSIDMKAGRLLGAWPDPDAWSVAQRALGLGVRRLLVLDLAAVGKDAGVATADLCARLRHQHPTLEIATGGGVRSQEDVRRLEDLGVNHVLVASALHDGKI